MSTASTSVKESEKLQELLTVILALGNFLNHGKANSDAPGKLILVPLPRIEPNRDLVPGFSLRTLRRLEEVKGSDGSTLLHCLVDVLGKHYPHLLRLRRDLTGLFDAARISGGELELEMGRLEAGLADVRRELALLTRSATPTSSSADSAIEGTRPLPRIAPSFPRPSHPTHTSDPEESASPPPCLEGDAFVGEMEAFLAVATEQLEELQSEMGQMRLKVSSSNQLIGWC